MASKNSEYSPRRTVESLIQQAADTPDETDFGNVSVSLQERHETMARAAEMYADYNKRTVGLGKAVRIPEVLRDLEERYGIDSVPGVVSGAKNNSFYTPTGGELDFDNPPLELRMLEGVLKTNDLLAAGVDRNTLSAELQPMVVSIRHAIGTTAHGIKAKQRNAEIKKLKVTADRAKTYKQS